MSCASAGPTVSQLRCFLAFRRAARSCGELRGAKALADEFLLEQEKVLPVFVDGS